MILKMSKDLNPQPSKGMFSINRILPGKIIDSESRAPTFGPLSNIDHAFMSRGLTIKMHEHIDDEILSYVDIGSSIHRDSAGFEVPIERGKLMVMNAGKSFWHEEKVPKDGVEMLQIFVRPSEPNLEAKVQFHEKPTENPNWYVMVGPEGSDMPMTVRQNVYIMDAHVEVGESLDIPTYKGLAPFLYVMHGEIEVGGVRAERFEALADMEEEMPALTAVKDATVVLFFVDMNAPMSTRGTISGLKQTRFGIDDY